MRLMKWVMTGAVLAAICVPIDLRAEEPSTRPAPAGERRGGPDRPGPGRPGAPGGGARRMGPAPGELIEEFRTIAKDLNLTDEQKTKVEAALKTAAEEFKTLRDDDTIDPRDRRTRAEEILGTMRKDVSGALTEEQRQTLRKKMNELRPPGGQRRGGEGPSPTTRPGPLGERLRQNLAKLDLSHDQKKKVETVLADAKKQGEELRDGLMSGDEQAREKMGEIMMEVRREIGEILTQEQRDKLMDLMPPPGDGGPQPPPPGGQRRPRRPGGDEMKGDDMQGGEMREGGPGNRSRQRQRDEPRPRGPTAAAPAPDSGAKIGTPAPAFELTRLDGKPVRPSTFQGRVGVIVFGSYSSPSFRQRAPEIEALAKQFGSRAQFLIVYTKEAHPAADWEVERNKDAGIAVEAHKDAAARAAQAEKTEHALKLTIPIAPDTMDDAVSAAFGAFPNGAVVLSREGVIVARQQWVDPGGLEKRIEQALKTPTSKPAD
jgi:Spy/CpxP family protein refolding chaperone